MSRVARDIARVRYCCLGWRETYLEIGTSIYGAGDIPRDRY